MILSNRNYGQVVLYNLDKEWQVFNPLTPKISSVILPTVCHTIHVMLVWRIWNWINQ